jgi:hypothetical protein
LALLVSLAVVSQKTVMDPEMGKASGVVLTTARQRVVSGSGLIARAFFVPYHI